MKEIRDKITDMIDNTNPKDGYQFEMKYNSYTKINFVLIYKLSEIPIINISSFLSEDVVNDRLRLIELTIKKYSHE